MTPTDLLVPPEQEGQRLDRFLTSFLGGHSRSQLQKLITDGLRHRRRAVRPRPISTLRDGDRVRIELPEPVASEVDGRRAAARDPVSGRRPRRGEQAGRHGGAPGRRPCVRHAGERAAPSPVRAERHRRRAAAGHRAPSRSRHVGRDGRGQARRAHQELSRQFHDREVEKEYIALVWGVVQAGRRIDAAIGRDPSDRQKMSIAVEVRA